MLFKVNIQRGLGSFARIMKTEYWSVSGFLSSDLPNTDISCSLNSGKGSGWPDVSFSIFPYNPDVLTNCTCTANLSSCHMLHEELSAPPRC